MNATDRRELTKVRAMLMAGDRAGALDAIRALVAAPPPVRVGVMLTSLQLALRFMAEVECFRCERMHVTMPVRYCLELRAAVWPSGKRRGCQKHLACVGCPVGAANASKLPGYSPRPPSQTPDILPPEQRRAKEAAQRARGDWAP